ncbi:MAG: TIGR02147 family protein [Pseudobdellovibrionaceae bacterium]
MQSTSNSDLAIVLLELEYQKRFRKNPKYSLRAFAKLLDTPPGRVSEYFSRKRKISPEMAEKLAGRLSFSPRQREDYIQLTQTGKKRTQKLQYAFLDEDKFSFIALWVNYAILALLETSDFRNDPKWIAERLNVGVSLVNICLQRLFRLSLVEEKQGTLVLTHRALTTSYDVTSAALKHHHRDHLAKSIEALDKIELELREISSITMAINMDKIKEAKTVIRKFQDKMARLLEDGNRTEVYNLNIQLVPLTNCKRGRV